MFHSVVFRNSASNCDALLNWDEDLRGCVFVHIDIFVARGHLFCRWLVERSLCVKEKDVREDCLKWGNSLSEIWSEKDKGVLLCKYVVSPTDSVKRRSSSELCRRERKGLIFVGVVRGDDLCEREGVSSCRQGRLLSSDERKPAPSHQGDIVFTQTSIHSRAHLATGLGVWWPILYYGDHDEGFLGHSVHV